MGLHPEFGGGADNLNVAKAKDREERLPEHTVIRKGHDVGNKSTATEDHNGFANDECPTSPHRPIAISMDLD